MGISLKTHKLLWGRSGNRCAFENCRKELAMTEYETDNPSLIGEEAHIVGKKESAARGKSDLLPEERDLYDNLILLCRNHHKLIDDNEESYKIELLKDFKRQHEEWVRKNLEFNSQDEFQILTYISYLEFWIENMDIDNWINWSSSFIFEPYNFIEKEFFDNFYEVERYIKSRVWFGEHLELEKAFSNFGKILEDLRKIYLMWAKEFGIKYETEKFYKTTVDRFDQELYNRRFEEWDFHTRLIGDLGLELTRAANYICNQVRNSISPSFRLKEGLVLTDSDKFIAVQYKDNEKEILYPGLYEFMTIRNMRDYNLGIGIHEVYEKLFR